MARSTLFLLCLVPVWFQTDVHKAWPQQSDRFGVALPQHATMRLESAHLRQIKPYRSDTDGIWGVAVSSKGLLVSAGKLGMPLRYWDAATGIEIPGPFISSGINLVFSPDGQILFISKYRAHAAAYDPATGKKLFELNLGRDNAGRACFAPNGRWLAITTYGSVLYFCDPIAASF